MAKATQLWDDLLKPLGAAFAQSYDTSGKVINSLAKGIDARFVNPDGSINKALVQATGGKVKRFKPGRKAEFNYKSGQEGGFSKGDVLEGPESAKIDNWMRAKSLFYDREGDLKYGRVAGAAVGFGGGAIATLNLGYDMIT